METSQQSLRQCLIEDMRMWDVPASHEMGPLRFLKYFIHLMLFAPGFACAFWYRINKVVYKRGWRRLAKFIHARRYYKFANDISYHAEIGPGFKVCHVSDIVIGANVKLGSHCKVFHGVTIGALREHETHLQPRIGDRAYIGTGAKVLGGITIGDDVTIGALTFCNKSVGSGSVAYGNPMVIQSSGQTDRT